MYSTGEPPISSLRYRPTTNDQRPMTNDQLTTMNTPSTNDIKASINKEFDKLCHQKCDGTFIPFVCAICDEFLTPKRLALITIPVLCKYGRMLATTEHNGGDNDLLRNNYKYAGDLGSYDTTDARNLINELFLSPRASLISTKESNNHSEGLTVCKSCKSMLCASRMPRFAIANNYCFGSTPACLSDLTEIELAMITPVKAKGYCFAWTGGKHRHMQGSLSYYKINMESIATSICHFTALGMTDNIVILLYGEMTETQKRIARRKREIRVAYIRRALYWLIANNAEWQKANISVTDIISKLNNPTIKDISKNVESDNSKESNIEQTESYQIFFPDGTIGEASANQDNVYKYRELVKQAVKAGYNLEVKNNFIREHVVDYKDDNLVNACLLQFPYGRGGLHELRARWNGSLTRSVDMNEYLKHLTYLSLPQFHRELFVLIVYNLNMKQRMLRTAGWKVREGINATDIAIDLTANDIDNAIANHGRPGTGPRNAGGKFIRAVDAVTSSVPHGNQAVKRARSKGDSHQHHFGTSSYWLTVTPDDDNSFLVQVFANNEIDDDTKVSDISDDTLQNRARERTALRLRFPGICALFFEIVLDIVIRHVLKWDRENECSIGIGLFGETQAFAIAVEEQARKTLHAHMQIWIKDFASTRENLHSGRKRIRREAANKITTAYENVASCKLLRDLEDINNRYNAAKYFPHECTVPRVANRQTPIVVNNQDLCHLRYKDCTKTKFAYCPHCTHSWTAESLIENYLINSKKIPGLTEYPDHVRRLKAMAVQFQRQRGIYKDLPECIVDAAYNTHLHQNKSCFAKKDKLRKKSVGECRYRLPRLGKRRTIIQRTQKEKIRWLKWDGTVTERYVYEFALKRAKLDAFQNGSCPAISQSKLTCNTNLSAVSPGPIAQYQYSYGFKDNQKEEQEPYENLSRLKQRVLASIPDEDTTHRSHAIRRVLAGAFAHQASNVVAAPLASFMTRQTERFIFSHSHVYCPLRDLKAITDKKPVYATVQFCGNKPMLRSDALNYLCRPKELETESPLTYFAKYETIRRNKENEESLLPLDNEYHDHPAFCNNDRTENNCTIGVRKRKIPALTRVHTFDFPDTDTFGSSILDKSQPTNDAKEAYAYNVNHLVLPYRTKSDLMIEQSYVTRLQTAFQNDELSTSSIQFLQNIQDTKSNSYRAHCHKDELQRCTNPYTPPPDEMTKSNGNDDDENEEQNVLQGPDLDTFLNAIAQEATIASQTTDTPSTNIPATYSTSSIREKGSEKAGFTSIADMPTATTAEREKFIHIPTEPMNDKEQDVAQTPQPNGNKPSKRELITIALHHATRRKRSFAEVTKQHDNVVVQDANGTATSIIDWAIKAKMDKEQRRAFEIITATFVLTFYDDTDEEAMYVSQIRHLYSKYKTQLELLADRKKRFGQNLICFLHGPGGSGKSTVINLILLYAREFCDKMTSYNFTSRTIVVTAMTGVAATILMGDTIHNAAHLNQKRPLEDAQIENWEESRLVFLDEVSFADRQDFGETHRKIRLLKQQINKRYGGMNMVVAGDLRQLEPVGRFKQPIYKKNCPEFRDWINCYIELKGLHRFKEDRPWGELLNRMRDGEITEQDIDKINTRVVDEKTVLPVGIKYATYFNKDRDAINAAVFNKHCQNSMTNHGNANDAVLIFSDKIKIRNGSNTYVPMRNCNHFWNNCGEDDVKLTRGEGRLDPVLKLYLNCPVMLPSNINVSQGKANGTQATVSRIVLRQGIQPHSVKLENSIPVRAVYASDVENVELCHVNKRIEPPLFKVTASRRTFLAKIPKPPSVCTNMNETEHVRMQANQIPIIVNNATTGHKLQGADVTNIFVHCWSYVTNWAYVMLSRVTTLNGLHMRKALSKDLTKYEMPKELKALMNFFATKRSPTYWDEQDYEELFPNDTTAPPNFP